MHEVGWGVVEYWTGGVEVDLPLTSHRSTKDVIYPGGKGLVSGRATTSSVVEDRHRESTHMITNTSRILQAQTSIIIIESTHMITNTSRILQITNNNNNSQREHAHDHYHLTHPAITNNNNNCHREYAHDH